MVYNKLNVLVIVFMLFTIYILFPASISFGAENMRLMKVMLKNNNTLDDLKLMGFALITVQNDYAIIRISEENTKYLTDRGLFIVPASEKDLVRRRIKIRFSDEIDLNNILNSGIDIWQIDRRNKFVIGQAFDNYINQLREKKINVEIIP